jgi:sugar lactone lactonase YvrE
MWCDSQNALFWVDIFGKKIHRLCPATGQIRSWLVPELIGWIIERRNGNGFVAGLKSGFAFLGLDPVSIEWIGNPETDRPFNRPNDAKADRQGRIWAGTKDDRDQEATGALYRLDPGLQWSRVDDRYAVANGPTFSLDYRTVFHTDSAARTVYALDLADNGDIVKRRVWLRFEEEWGYPDGMATDAEGCIWIAHWGGARVSRFRANGKLDRSIAMPTTNITSVTFGGPDLGQMFVTSASYGCEGEPDAGALFEVDAGVEGIPTNTFAG